MIFNELAFSIIKKRPKKTEIRAMFNSIARRYDFLNHFFSLGIDVLWRKRLIRELKKFNPVNVIDIATGTADLAILAAKRGIPSITGIDLSSNMIEIGVQKVLKQNLQNVVDLKIGDAEELDFIDDQFDAAMVAFGIRNFENLEKGLGEISRVLKEGSPLLILEFSKPTVFPVKQFYYLYSRIFLPFLGRIISTDKKAYSYLPESIAEFPYGNSMIQIFQNCGYENCCFIPLSFQIATLYIGIKKKES
jgi:demethylmenaquinone methyltransferase / 2-methoxy-6-polyprenyl-1,4-benzoquinol methylase